MAQKTDTVLRFRWIAFVSRRFSRVDKNGRSAVTSFFASLGICFGIMTLIVVMSVMNGIQKRDHGSVVVLHSSARRDGRYGSALRIVVRKRKRHRFGKSLLRSAELYGRIFRRASCSPHPRSASGYRSNRRRLCA